MIDESLSDVLQLLFRDYVSPWYSLISQDESFVAHIKDLFHEVVVNLSNKAREVDWVSIFTLPNSLHSGEKFEMRLYEELSQLRPDRTGYRENKRVPHGEENSDRTHVAF